MRTRRKVLLATAAIVGAPLLGWAAYAAVSWRAFGRPHTGASDPLMTRYMPRADIVELHRTRIAAAPAEVYAAAREMDLQESPVIRAIFRGRERLLRAAPPDRPAHLPLITEMLSLGWGVLDEEPGRAIVLGTVTQPWKSDVVFRPLPPAEFAAFDSAGYVKIVVSFAALPLDDGGSEFRTETRALATDAESRRKFRRYWSVFSPGIRLIRTQSLQLVRRDAERRARTVMARAPG